MPWYAHIAGQGESILRWIEELCRFQSRSSSERETTRNQHLAIGQEISGVSQARDVHVSDRGASCSLGVIDPGKFRPLIVLASPNQQLPVWEQGSGVKSPPRSHVADQREGTRSWIVELGAV